MEDNYKSKYNCQACGGVNEVFPTSIVGCDISEAETVCESCHHEDYWAYGYFESQKEDDSDYTVKNIFKIGDKVVRNTDSYTLNKGTVYTVKSVVCEESINLEEAPYAWYSENFSLYTEPEIEVLSLSDAIEALSSGVPLEVYISEHNEWQTLMNDYGSITLKDLSTWKLRLKLEFMDINGYKVEKPLATRPMGVQYVYSCDYNRNHVFKVKLEDVVNFHNKFWLTEDAARTACEAVNSLFKKTGE